MPYNEPFSKRMGHREPPSISMWDEAPEQFRYGVLRIAIDDIELPPEILREIVCKTLKKRPNPNNWNPDPNIWNELVSLAMKCEWFEFFDILEAIAAGLDDKPLRRKSGYVNLRQKFDGLVSDLMVDIGLGWKLDDGLLKTRGEESYEKHLSLVMDALAETHRSTAITEMKEAIRDVSRRPSPDNSGAIQHSMAALECVARHAANDPKPTLGTLIKEHPDLIPKPVDTAIEKLWGYTSEVARHGREGNEPTREEAMMVVGIAATLVNYLIHKTKKS
jgi:hypothetical protein